VKRVLLALALIGCNKSAAPPAPAPAAPAAPEAAVVAKTPAELAARYQECYAQANAGELDAYAACFAPRFVSKTVDLEGDDMTSRKELVETFRMARSLVDDMRVEPQLVIAGDGMVAAVLLSSGRFDGHTTGVYMGNLVELDAQGLVSREWTWNDEKNLDAQLEGKPVRPAVTGGKVTVVAANDPAAASASAAASKALREAWNRRDRAALAAALGDGFIWHESTAAKDDRAESFLDAQARLWEAGFTLEVDKSFAVADHVVTAGALKGKDRSVGVLTIERFAAGKLVAGWRFMNGAKLE
jgi:hypothetical protein